MLKHLFPGPVLLLQLFLSACASPPPEKLAKDDTIAFSNASTVPVRVWVEVITGYPGDFFNPMPLGGATTLFIDGPWELPPQTYLRQRLAQYPEYIADIRKANYDPTNVNATAPSPVFTLQNFSQTQLTFTMDLNSNGSLDTSPVETLGYRLSNGSLQLWQNTAWRTVLTGVTDTQLFPTFLDAQGVSLDCIALSTNSCDTSQTRSIAAVTITLTAQASTGGTPGLAKPSIQETATAVFRNPVY